MKMSGLNVAYDSLISTAYSGVVGGLVIYVADDPGVSAGMAEQDSRGFALMADLPMLEPVVGRRSLPADAGGFDLSEKTGTPVFVRLVTANSSSYSTVDVDDEPAGSAGAGARADARHQSLHQSRLGHLHGQHRDLIARLDQAGQLIDERG